MYLDFFLRPHLWVEFACFQIESIILNRAEVIRDQTAALMAETEDERDKQLLQSARKKNRVSTYGFLRTRALFSSVALFVRATLKLGSFPNVLAI